MIELKNICKSYGNLQVLRNVNLSVADREIVAIVGPSGAGKTTLLQIAGTLDRPDSGEVLYDGVEITRLKDRKLSEFRNRNIGFIFQFHQLMPEFTAAENVAMPAMIAGVSRRKALARASELLEMLGLGDRLRHKPSELSGGERQRAAIARALINSPKVVFADEPTGSLDSRNRDEIRALIADLRERLGQTFVIVTHDPTVSQIADRVINMADGSILPPEPQEELQPESEEKLPESEETEVSQNSRLTEEICEIEEI